MQTSSFFFRLFLSHRPSNRLLPLQVQYSKAEMAPCLLLLLIFSRKCWLALKTSPMKELLNLNRGSSQFPHNWPKSTMATVFMNGVHPCSSIAVYSIYYSAVYHTASTPTLLEITPTCLGHRCAFTLDALDRPKFFWFFYFPYLALTLVCR